MYVCIYLSIYLYIYIYVYYILKARKQADEDVRQMMCFAGAEAGKTSPALSFAKEKVCTLRVPGKGISNSRGARPVHLIITILEWGRGGEDQPCPFFREGKGLHPEP